MILNEDTSISKTTTTTEKAVDSGTIKYAIARNVSAYATIYYYCFAMLCHYAFC